MFSGLAILCERKPVTLHTKHKSEDLLVSDSNGTHEVRLTFPFHCEQPGSAGTEGHVDSSTSVLQTKLLTRTKVAK